MVRFLKAFLILALTSLALSGALAQNSTQLAPGDPPVAALINISQPDENGIVTITGSPGAVFPAGQVAVRNLYTEDVVYAQAGVTGAFSVTIFGPGNTPFWISPAQSIPNDLRDVPGSLPGGPGTIIYGPFPETATANGPTTQLLVDGLLTDWEAGYAQSQVLSDPTTYALVNQDALFAGFALADAPADYAQIAITFTLDGALYALTFDPRVEQLASLRRLQPNETDLGTLAINAIQGDAIEVRVPFLSINPTNTAIENATLERVIYLGQDNAELLNVTVQQPVTLMPNEQSGIVHLNSDLGDDFTRFTVSGPVSGGASQWAARGRINTVNFAANDQVVVELDVTLTAPALPAGLVGLKMIGELGLQPVIGPAGNQAAGGLNSGNGWANVLTPGGLAVTNLISDVPVATTVTPWQQLVRRDNQLVFALNFTFTLPEDLPAGRYVPVFKGLAQVADGEAFTWESNNIWGEGEGLSRLPLTRLPVVLGVGGVENAHLVWTLFQDQPSDGSRGVLTDQDKGQYALSNRVRFDAPTYILPRSTGPEGETITYPLEPYLLNQMPNAYDTTVAPLVPFLFPGGRLSVKVNKPDGGVDNLGSTPIIQNQLSTKTLDERNQFGAQSPIDVYRLTTLNPLFTQYRFEQYGEYAIELSGTLEDVWGNSYEGGGTYHILVAEPLDLLPGVLSGTPFEVGNTFYPGVRVEPGAPADITITARIYPLDGSAVIEHRISGEANRYGYFYAADGNFTFDVPGEYVIDYEARYTDAEGKLWAASLRSAGVIAEPDSRLIAHGERGLNGVMSDVRPAWFLLNRYLQVATALVEGSLNYPYNAGDVVWISPNNELNPIIQAQDQPGTYASWLIENRPADVNAAGLSLFQAASQDELPVGTYTEADNPFGTALLAERIVNEGYYYISAVRPDVTARQFVAGGLEANLPLSWNWNDPYNSQIGTGATGSRPGDYLFLFGGAVVRNDAAQMRETAIYASLAVTIDPNDPSGPRVFPPYQGQADGANGGPLLTINGQNIDMFFHPTGVQPGQTLTVGDTLAVAGQVAPTLPSQVAITVTAPSGKTYTNAGTANRIGYFYNPAANFAVDEAGVWTVDVTVRHEGLTSAGPIVTEPPTGGVLGTENGRFEVYVLPVDATPLTWNQDSIDLRIPAAFPYNFNMNLPADWTNIQIYHTVTTPSYVLEQGALRPGGGMFIYQYNPANLARIFPNIESNGVGSGPAGSDVVTVTLVATGTDANGRAQIQTRTFTIMHDRLTTFN